MDRPLLTVGHDRFKILTFKRSKIVMRKTAAVVDLSHLLKCTPVRASPPVRIASGISRSTKLENKPLLPQLNQPYKPTARIPIRMLYENLKIYTLFQTYSHLHRVVCAAQKRPRVGLKSNLQSHTTKIFKL